MQNLKLHGNVGENLQGVREDGREQLVRVNYFMRMARSDMLAVRYLLVVLIGLEIIEAAATWAWRLF